MCKTNKNARNDIMSSVSLPRDKISNGSQEIEYAKMSSLSSEGKTKPNTTEFPFLYYYS